MQRPAARPLTRAQRKKRLALLVTMGFVVGLGAAEIALRVKNAWLHPAIYEIDAELGWRHTREVDRTMRDENGRAVRFATDARGLRIVPGAGSSDTGKQRVLFVGDSFTEASQVEAEEAFASLLAAAVGDMQAFNAGVGGYSTLQQLLALPAWLRGFDPSLVVLVVYENDFEDNLMPYFSGLGPRPYMRVVGDDVQLVRDPDIDRFEPFLQPAPGAFWLYRHCALYRAVQKNLFLPRHQLELAEREANERSALTETDKQHAMAILLRRFVGVVRAGSCRLLVAAIPARAEASQNGAPSHAWLASLCGELDTPFVSLLPALHQAPAELAYYVTDIHLTRIGHEHVARALAPSLADQLRR